MRKCVFGVSLLTMVKMCCTVYGKLNGVRSPEVVLRNIHGADR